MSGRLWLCGLVALLVGCPPSLADDDDATADDDDITADDDDAVVDDDDAVVDDDDSIDPDDDDTIDDDDDTIDDDDDDGVEPAYCLSLVPESDVLAAVYGGPKVPAGYWSDTATNAIWWDPCTSSVADTETAAAAQYPGASIGASSSTTWYHQAEVVLDTGNTVLYRNTRCDYWDGSILAAPLPVPGWTEAQELAGYLWWTDNHNFGGAHIVGGWGTVGDATNFFELCHVTTVYGDWGLNDEISVWSQSFGIGQFDGSVWIQEPQLEGVIVGNLN